MKRRKGKLIKKLQEILFKRATFAKKTLAKPTQVYKAEIVASSAARAGATNVEGGIVRYGRTGIEKVSRGEGAAYNRFFKSKKFVKPATLGTGAAITEAKIINEAASASKFWPKAKTVLGATAKFAGSAAAWWAVDAALDYVFDKHSKNDDPDVKNAAYQAAQDHIAQITKASALEDALEQLGVLSDDGVDKNTAYYEGPELNHMAELVKRALKDLSLQATGELTSMADKNTLKAATIYEKADLIIKLVNIVKLVASESNADETLLLLARQAMCSSLPSAGWTEGFESIVRSGDIESTAVQAIASEFNAVYEGLYEEARIDVADTYFNEVTNLVNLKSDRSGDFALNEASSNGALAKLRMGLASMMTDNSIADVEGWWDRLKVDKDNPRDDEYLAAQEMLRYSTQGSDFIGIFIAAARGDYAQRQRMLNR